MTTIFFYFIRFQACCLFIGVLFFFTPLCAQKGSIWVSRDSVAIDFRYDPPKIFTIPLPNSIPDTFISAPVFSSSSIRIDDTTYFYLENYEWNYPEYVQIECDTSPNPVQMFFTALGANLRNQNHEIVPNGDYLAMSSIEPLNSHFVPLNDSVIFIFAYAYNDGQFMPRGSLNCMGSNTHKIYQEDPRLYYHKLERKSNVWRVTEKNKITADDADIVAKFAVTRHANGKDWWIIAHERNASNCFLRFLLNEWGVTRYPNQCIGRVHLPTYLRELRTDYQQAGQMAFSKDGSKLAIASKCRDYRRHNFWGLVLVDTIPILDVFDFDRCSGTLYNYKNYGIKIPKPIWHIHRDAYGCQFSPNNKYLYYTSISGPVPIAPSINNRIFCFDLQNDSLSYIETDTLENFSESVYPIEIRTGPKDELYFKSNLSRRSRKYIAKIRYPDRGLANSGYVRKGLFLEGKQLQYDLSNNPNYELGGLAVQYHRHDTTHCYWRPLQLGISRSLDSLYYYNWYSLEKTLKLKGDTQSGNYTHKFEKEKEGSYRFVRHRFAIAEGCTTHIDTFVVQVSKKIPPCYTGVEATSTISPQLKIYPNPVQDVLRISSNRNILRIHFYDLTGKRIVTREPLDPILEYDFDVSGMATGAYLCEIETDLGKLRQRVVVERY